MTRINKRGFTLVEILIVVIILGILAAIVIPQFTNASTDARNSSAKSMLQTLRSQVELYKLQHGDRWPTSDGLLAAPSASTFDWNKLTTRTETDGTAGNGDNNDVGPYMQSASVNPHRNGSFVVIVADDAAALASTPAAPTALQSTTQGWVMSRTTGKIWAFEPSNNTADGDADYIVNE